jgi:hypothetical protein
MASDELLASWDRTRGHLSRAWCDLPSGEEGLGHYQEYLDHNELALAMEALADAGVERKAETSFWLALADAAREMGLGSTVEDYHDRAAR